MVMQAWNPCTWRLRLGERKFKDSPCYTGRSCLTRNKKESRTSKPTPAVLMPCLESPVSAEAGGAATWLAAPACAGGLESAWAVSIAWHRPSRAVGRCLEGGRAAGLAWKCIPGWPVTSGNHSVLSVGYEPERQDLERRCHMPHSSAGTWLAHTLPWPARPRAPAPPAWRQAPGLQVLALLQATVSLKPADRCVVTPQLSMRRKHPAGFS